MSASNGRRPSGLGDESAAQPEDHFSPPPPDVRAAGGETRLSIVTRVGVHGVNVPGSEASSSCCCRRRRARGRHPEDELARQQGELRPVVEPVPGVPLQGSGVVGRGRLDEARVEVGLEVKGTERRNVTMCRGGTASWTDR
ncbi:hypothetical protein EYF80_039658 [Liparis tanakae]|uniref:Uncharacterized protein n=1 Tax=Liparis tanakae TaxID=230148 RepID=A0A4Z2GBM0_9TELE|nr:hypothetical protein EYF80_039658 [Liparis tanakae]